MPEYTWPVRRGAKAFLRMPDGTEKEIDALTVALQVQAWAEVAGGLACYQATTVIPVLEGELAKARE